MQTRNPSLFMLASILAFGASACGGSTDAESNSVAGSATEPLGFPHHEHHDPQILVQTNLVSNQPGQAAQTDPQLQNAWGLAFSPTGKPWVSANETGLSQVYDDAGNLLLSVTVPPAKGAEPPSHPTGQVFNADASAFAGDKFIFVTEDGTISGWQSGNAAVLRADNSAQGAIYKGVAIAKAHGKTRLYAADFHNGKVDVFDSAYGPVNTRGHFVDPFLPANYAPFNILALGPRLLVAFAQQALPEKEDDVAGAGHGFVAVFDAEGHFLQPLISRGALNSPWGMAIAPKGFGDLSDKLLVGNFGDGRINAYRIDRLGFFLSARFHGPVRTAAHAPPVIDGLWALVFEPETDASEPPQLYFTAGPNDEEDGLFGRLDLPH